MNEQLVDVAVWSLQHFESMDTANAAMHCAPVRYSPITFRIARALHGANIVTPEVLRVVEHDGAYEEDRGR